MMHTGPTIVCFFFYLALPEAIRTCPAKGLLWMYSLSERSSNKGARIWTCAWESGSIPNLRWLDPPISSGNHFFSFFLPVIPYVVCFNCECSHHLIPRWCVEDLFWCCGERNLSLSLSLSLSLCNSMILCISKLPYMISKHQWTHS